MRSESAQPRIIALRGRCAALALVFLAAVLGPVLHGATTLHEACAEHGELVHADGAAAVQAGRIPAAAHAGVGTAPSATEESGHAHCVLSPAPETRRDVPVGAASSVLPPTSAKPAPALAYGAPPDVARYLLAPKQSPPV